MLGSLNKIWPWRKATEWLRDSNGQILLDDDGVSPKKILKEINISPSTYATDLQLESHTMLAIVAMILGIALVLLLDRSNKAEADA